jgi:hypothetical protein
VQENTPTQDEWSRLYQAAIRVKEMSPWEWMTETDIFGVEDPKTGDKRFISVMGMLGEHYSVAVYLGWKGLYKFWSFQERGHESTPEDFFEIPQLQASYENRKELTKKDREVIKELGLKFRGRQAWPMFRSYRPGYFPWYVDRDEARMLTCALEQVEEMAPKLREDASLFESGGGESYLMRVYRAGEWIDEMVEIMPPEPTMISMPMDVEALEALKKARRQVRSVEMDFFMLPARIGERGKRPTCAYALLVVESRSGMILGNELLGPEPTLEEMYGRVPVTVVHLLVRTGLVPREVKVKSELLCGLLQPLGEELGLRIRQTRRLPNLEPAKANLMQWMGGGR